jgi:membrane protein implicated in regulation of membrane protease activity
MPLAASGTRESLVLSAALVAIAAYFAVRQWRERRGRPTKLDAADARHFARQDWRRGLGSAVMTLIAIGLVVGTRLDPRAGRLERRLFLAVWLGVIALLSLLLVLAMLDWLAIRDYARRHRDALADERYAALVEERRKRLAAKDGRTKPSNGQPGR